MQARSHTVAVVADGWAVPTRGHRKPVLGVERVPHYHPRPPAFGMDGMLSSPAETQQQPIDLRQQPRLFFRSSRMSPARHVVGISNLPAE
jgi:hypothetical protein